MDKNVKEAADTMRGVTVDIADNEKVTSEMVKEATRELNDNPRDNNLDE